MQIDLRTVTIKPLRHTFSHVARRLGDKPASRYQEGTLDLQADVNFHYRPLWDPEHEIFDAGRTAVVMADWYAFKDPRQFYYGTYTMARAKQQEAAESAFDFVEDRGLIEMLPPDVRELALQVLLPLRHLEWGGNMNNSAICAYGFGAAVTQPAMFHAMDHLGIAQYLTRIGLELADPAVLDQAKEAWMNDAVWQGLRRYIENTFVLSDWFELFVAQNLVLDGLIYPLVFEAFDKALTRRGGGAISMLTQFMREWRNESVKWVDATIKTAAAESPANLALLQGWVANWRAQAYEAVKPLAELALGQEAGAALDDIATAFDRNLNKLGLSR